MEQVSKTIQKGKVVSEHKGKHLVNEYGEQKIDHYKTPQMQAAETEKATIPLDIVLQFKQRMVRCV